jgi:competence protein ComEC
MAERARTPSRVQGVAGTWPPDGGVRTGRFTAGFGVWSEPLEKLREWVRAEAGPGRLLPWVPVAFAFYFAAAHEPVLSVAVMTALGLAMAAFLLRRTKFLTVAASTQAHEAVRIARNAPRLVD